MKVRSDVTKLEQYLRLGVGFEVDAQGQIVHQETKEVLYEPESKEEATKFKRQRGRTLILQMQGSKISLVVQETKRTILEWGMEVAIPRILSTKGIIDNKGNQRKDLDTLPYLTLALSDAYGVPIVIIRDKITKRVDHLALFAGKVGINQRGQVYDYERIRDTGGYCEVLRQGMSAKEAREYYKGKKIEHTMRETKKEMRQLVVNRPIVLDIQIRTGEDIRTYTVTEYTETKDKILFKNIINREVQPRQMGVPKGTVLGLQIRGLM